MSDQSKTIIQTSSGCGCTTFFIIAFLVWFIVHNIDRLEMRIERLERVVAPRDPD